MPAPVSTDISVLSVSLWSYTYFATQRMPFPHISASEPSALYILILKSALSDGPIVISPSEPIPKCLSLTYIDTLAGSSNFSSKRFTFGKDSESIIKLYETAGYVSKEYYENDKDIKRAVDFILNPAVVKLGNKTRLERLYNELLNKDWFMTLIDFNAYVDAKEQILADYEDQDSWNEKVVHNIAKAGFFSSDRTIAQYNADIWHCEG